MSYYRFYCIADGHITRAEDHECADDGAAHEKAAALILLISNKWCEVIEVWQRDRRVAIVHRGDAETS